MRDFDSHVQIIGYNRHLFIYNLFSDDIDQPSVVLNNQTPAIVQPNIEAKSTFKSPIAPLYPFKMTRQMSKQEQKVSEELQMAMGMAKLVSDVDRRNGNIFDFSPGASLTGRSVHYTTV